MEPTAKWKQYLYYILIGIISFISLVFLPMFGSEVGMAFTFPTSAAGWIVFIITQLLMAIVNVLIFHSFICQAKINIKDDTKYNEAKSILQLYILKSYVPRSLSQFTRREYGMKGVSIAIGTLLAGFALTQAILTYDYVRMLSYLFTITFGVIFGILEMKKWEEYYTGEFYDYALYYQKKKEEEERKKQEEENAKQIMEQDEGGRPQSEVVIEESVELDEEKPIDPRNATIIPNWGADLLVAPDRNGIISPIN